jgi:hypothetical protein
MDDQGSSEQLIRRGHGLVRPVKKLQSGHLGAYLLSMLLALIALLITASVTSR